MTDSERSKCKAIIHTATATCTAVAGGLAQLPGSDYVPISAAQITMVIGLGQVFGQSISKSAAQGIIKGLAGASVGRFLSQVVVGWIPGFGNAVNAATAASITEALGWKVAKKFDAERNK